MSGKDKAREVIESEAAKKTSGKSSGEKTTELVQKEIELRKKEASKKREEDKAHVKERMSKLAQGSAAGGATGMSSAGFGAQIAAITKDRDASGKIKVKDIVKKADEQAKPTDEE